MKYELAKQLKDAGFPLQAASMEDGNDSKRKHQIFYYGKDSFDSDGAWLYPTLSELIEACEEDFEMLVQRNTHQCWGAVGGSHRDERGKLPEEAVAKLWLALHA
jgi:hypothetical protein